MLTATCNRLGSSKSPTSSSGTGTTVVFVPGLELAVAEMPADPFTEG